MKDKKTTKLIEWVEISDDEKTNAFVEGEPREVIFQGVGVDSDGEQYFKFNKNDSSADYFEYPAHTVLSKLLSKCDPGDIVRITKLSRIQSKSNPLHSYYDYKVEKAFFAEEE